MVARVGGRQRFGYVVFAIRRCEVFEEKYVVFPKALAMAGAILRAAFDRRSCW